MDIIELGAIGELLGGIAVVASLEEDVGRRGSERRVSLLEVSP